MRNGNIVSEQPVEVKMPNGNLNANRLEVTNSGEVIRFDRGVDASSSSVDQPDGGRRDEWRTHVSFGSPRCAALALARKPALAAAPAAGPPKRCKASRRTATSRSRSGRPRSKCATRRRSRPSPATSRGAGRHRLRCKTLVVFYEDTTRRRHGKTRARMPTAQPGPAAATADRALEAGRRGRHPEGSDRDRGNGEFDMRTNTVTLTGNVVVTQGHNVLRGQRSSSNSTTGVSRMESAAARVEGLINPQPPRGKPAAEPQPRAARSIAKPRLPRSRRPRRPAAKS